MYEIKVSGMTCGGCVNSISHALKAGEPLADVEVDLEAQTVRVKSSREQNTIVALIEEAGFKVLATKKIGH